MLTCISNPYHNWDTEQFHHPPKSLVPNTWNHKNAFLRLAFYLTQYVCEVHLRCTCTNSLSLIIMSSTPLQTAPQIVHCLLTHPLKDSWVLSSSWPLGIKLLQTTVYQFYVNLILLSVVQTGRSGTAESYGNCKFSFKESAKLLSRTAVPRCVPISNVRKGQWLCILTST